MKHTYIAPEIEVIEMNIETALMALSAESTLPGTSTGNPDEGTGKDADANGRRGEWGNLWS